MRKGVFALLAGTVLAVASAAPAWASDVVLFDPDGAGPIVGQNIDVLDPAPGNTLSVGLNANSPGCPVPPCAPASIGTLLFQANIANATIGSNPAFGFTFGSAGNPAFTIAVTAQERLVSNVGGSQTFAAPVLDNSLQGLFAIYAQPTNGNNLSGVCFVQSCGGVPILTGQIINNGNFAGTFTFNPNAPLQALDQAGANNYMGVNTIVGNGGFSVDILVQTVNAAYFPTLIAGQSLVFGTSEQILPFKQADPSACFSSDAKTSCNVGGAGTANVGAVNGLGPDTMLQSDANLSFQGVRAVPEPASLTLLGLGLLGSAAARRRKNAKK